MPLTIYTGGAKVVDTHVEHVLHKYGHSCALDPVRLGRCHTHRHLGGFSIGSTCLLSRHPSVFTA